MENTLYFLLGLLAVVVVLVIALVWQSEIEIGQVKLGKLCIKNIRLKPRKDTAAKN